MDGGKTVTDNVDGGIICEQNCRVWREDRRKIVEEGGTKYRALGNTRGREARRRVRVSNTSDMATIREI